jgi:hypothetical protein
LGVLPLLFLDLSNLIIIRGSEFVKPKIRVYFRILSIPVRARLLRTRYPVVGWSV